MHLLRVLVVGWAAAVVGMATPASSGAVAGGEVSSDVEAYVESWREANGVPGAAVAVIDGEGVETYVSGEDGDGDAVSPETPFLVGSIAKTFTSKLVLDLAAEGRISLDDPIGKHLPSGDLPSATVRQLLTHTAGFTAADGLAVSERYDNEPGALRRAVADLEHHGTPGEYAYNSADYLVLGALVEEVTGRPFGTVVDESVFASLGMTATTAEADGAESLPPGHRLWWGRARAYDPGFDESGAPYGYVASTLDDLTAYAQALLAGEVLPVGLESEAWKIQEVTGTKRGYGFGWSIDDGERRRVHHTGATPGYFAHVSLIPDDDRAVIVLANSYAESRAPSLTAAAVDIDEIARGGSADVEPGDPLLSSAPWALVGLASVGAVLALVARRRPRSTWLRRAGAVVAAVLAAALTLLLVLFGGSLRFVITWLPDLAVGIAVSCATMLVAAASFAARPRPSSRAQSRRDQAARL